MIRIGAADDYYVPHPYEDGDEGAPRLYYRRATAQQYACFQMEVARAEAAIQRQNTEECGYDEEEQRAFGRALIYAQKKAYDQLRELDLFDDWLIDDLSEIEADEDLEGEALVTARQQAADRRRNTVALWIRIFYDRAQIRWSDTYVNAHLRLARQCVDRVEGIVDRDGNAYDWSDLDEGTRDAILVQLGSGEQAAANLETLCHEICTGLTPEKKSGSDDSTGSDADPT
jgi:hypothetical protein